MAKLGGYAGNILTVDLSHKKIHTQSLAEDTARKFIGNRGLNARLLYDLLEPGADPLSPDNVLSFGTGPFMGTMIPSAGKSDLSFKSSLTSLIASSSSGQSGMIKFAGYDQLVITGKAETPVYLRIYDDDVEICDASNIWGMDVWATTDALRNTLGADYNMTVIGPAGENKCKGACIANEKYGFFGRQGGGAVMGSKNLKAIAVKGSKSIEVAEPKKFKKLVDKLFANIATGTDWDFPGSPFASYDEFKTLGTLVDVKNMEQYARVISAKNFQGAASYEQLQHFETDIFLARIKEGNIACMGCPIGCKHLLNIRDGKHQGLSLGASCVGSIIHCLAVACGVKEFDEAVKCFELCARYGFDVYNVFLDIAFAMELYERGVITKEDTGGVALEWGNAEVIREMIRKIAFREGIGDVLAESMREASKKIGKNAEKYTTDHRGLPVILDARAWFSPETFSCLTGFRKGHSTLFHASPMAMAGPERIRKFCKRIGMPEDAMGRVLGEAPPGYSIPKFIRYNEDFQDLLNLLGLCNHPFLFVRLDLELLSELYSALTGIGISPKELITCGERGYNLQRAFNAREGASREDDLPPKRFMTDVFKVKSWGQDGEDKAPLNKEELDKHLTAYYEERGWNVENGNPTKLKMAELSLDDIAKDIT